MDERYYEIPGNSGLPLLGNSLPFVSKTLDYLKDKYNQYGCVFKDNMFGLPCVFLLGSEANKLVLIDKEEMFSAQLGWEVIAPYFGGGLMFKDGATHKQHRYVMSQAFAPELMNNYIKRMHAIIESEINTIESKKIPNLHEYIKKLFLDISLHLFFGVNSKYESDFLYKNISNVIYGTTTVFRYNLPLTKHSAAISSRKKLINYLSEKCIMRRESNSSDTDVFTEIALIRDENGNFLTPTEVSEQMIFLMMAAHDTTASVTTMLLRKLAQADSLQSNVFDELRVRSIDDISSNNIMNIPLTDSVIHETLRMYPPLSVILRQPIVDYTYNGITIPKNINIVVSPLFTHYLQDYWENPMEFIAERFIEQSVKEYQKEGKWIPFGLGRHICLGQYFARIQMRLFLYCLFNKFQIKLINQTDAFKIQWVPILESDMPIQIELAKR